LNFRKALYLLFKSEQKTDYLIISIMLFSVFLVFFWTAIQQHFAIAGNIREGDTALRNYAINRNFKYINEIETEKLKNEALAKSRPVYDVYETKNISITEQCDDLFDYLDSLSGNNMPVSEAKYQFDKVFTNLRLSVESFETMYNNYKLNLFPARVRTIISTILECGYIQTFTHTRTNIDSIIVQYITTGEKTRQVKKISDIITESGLKNFILNYISLNFPVLTAGRRQAMADIVYGLIGQNLQYNLAATRQAEEESIAGVSTVYNELKKGAIIVKEGEILTKEKLLLLKKYSQIASINYPALCGDGLFFLAWFLVSLVFIFGSIEKIQKKKGSMLILCLQTVFIAVFFYLSGHTEFFAWLTAHIPSGYIIPFIFPVLTVYYIFGIQFTMAYTLIISIFSSFFVPVGQLNTFFSLLLSGFIIIRTAAKLKRRYSIWRAGGYNMLALFLLLFIQFLLEGWELPVFFKALAICAAVNITGITLVMSFLPLIELYLNLPTIFRLYELSDLNDPLFKELQLKAPGTYHHSMIVGTLAESAAKEIGENPLLARVGAYYHDIGKMDIPEYFIENQIDSDNRHDALEPTLSISIIKSHIKRGIELARNNRLPGMVIDIIHQHHGTTLIRYFYNRLQADQEKNRNLSKEDCSYPGPKPKSKIAAIVFLADTVEAATRSLRAPSPARIRSNIDKLVLERITESELSECGLTFSDIQRVKESFILVLTGIFHSRIEYPETETGDIQQRELT